MRRGRGVGGGQGSCPATGSWDKIHPGVPHLWSPAAAALPPLWASVRSRAHLKQHRDGQVQSSGLLQRWDGHPHDARDRDGDDPHEGSKDGHDEQLGTRRDESEEKHRRRSEGQQRRADGSCGWHRGTSNKEERADRARAARLRQPREREPPAGRQWRLAECRRWQSRPAAIATQLALARQGPQRAPRVPSSTPRPHVALSLASMASSSSAAMGFTGGSAFASTGAGSQPGLKRKVEALEAVSP